MCGNCQRYQLLCNYDRQPTKTAPSDKSPSVKNTSTDSVDYPESKNRRLLELRLLHQYTTKTSLTINLTAPGSTEQIPLEPWISNVPKIAFDNDALLNSMFAVAALHTAKTNPEDLEAIHVYHRYLDLALREHSKDVAHLTRLNADAACLSSSLIRLATFAILQERSLVPYTPPIQWLETTRGAGNIFREAWEFISDDESSIALSAVKRTPILKDPEALFQESSRQDLLHLLRGPRSEDATETWSADVEDAYASTLSYIGSVQHLIHAGEKPQTVCRILLMFPYLVEKNFIDLIKEQRPRALVILAHYFGLLTRFKFIWFIGDTGPREIRAISAFLSEEWLDLMAWPLQTLNDESSSA